MPKSKKTEHYGFDDIPKPTIKCTTVVPSELYKYANHGIFSVNKKIILHTHIQKCLRCRALFCAYRAARFIDKNEANSFEKLREKAKKFFKEFDNGKKS